MELISIITPFKNAAPWIAETIRSIQNQTHTNWELLLVDDHSTDNSRFIVEQLSESDARIKVFTNPQEGIIAALQFALEKSQGFALTRMDADDIMPKNRLKLMLDSLKNATNKSVITGKVSYFSEKQVSEGYITYQNWLNTRVENQDYFAHIYRECVVASPNWMVRTKEIKDAQLFCTLRYPEDYDMCFHWLDLGFKIIGVDEITLQWREHPLRTSRNSNIYQQKSFFKLKLQWFLKLHGLGKTIGIVGVGQKGKIAAEVLIKESAPISLYDLEFQKYGAGILGHPVLDVTKIKEEVILLARYPMDTAPIENFIKTKGYVIGKNAFWI